MSIRMTGTSAVHITTHNSITVLNLAFYPPDGCQCSAVILFITVNFVLLVVRFKPFCSLLVVTFGWRNWYSNSSNAIKILMVIYYSYCEIRAIHLIVQELYWPADESKRLLQYNSVYLTCSKKLTGSQLSPPHGTNRKYKNDECDRSSLNPATLSHRNLFITCWIIIRQ